MASRCRGGQLELTFFHVDYPPVNLTRIGRLQLYKSVRHTQVSQMGEVCRSVKSTLVWIGEYSQRTTPTHGIQPKVTLRGFVRNNRTRRVNLTNMGHDAAQAKITAESPWGNVLGRPIADGYGPSRTHFGTQESSYGSI